MNYREGETPSAGFHLGAGSCSMWSRFRVMGHGVACPSVRRPVHGAFMRD